MKEVLIDDVIGYDFWTGSGITLESVQKQLKGIEDGEDIHLNINSPGGSVYEGIVIFNLIRDYAKTHPISVRINCMAMSMASYIALAARTVDKNAKVTASENSIVMIHNPWGVSIGDYRELKKEADYFEKLAVLYGSVHAAVSGKTENEIRAAMDDETFYVGKEIIDVGFATDFEKISENETQGAGGVSASARDNILINAKFAFNKTIEMAEEAKKRDAAAYRGGLEKAVALFNHMAPKTPAALRAEAGETISTQGGLMTIEELKAQDKALYDEVFALGEEAGLSMERARVNAHILLGEKAGSLTLAAKFIKAGGSTGDETAQAEYYAAKLDGAHIAARNADNVGDIHTGGGGDNGGATDDAKLEAAFANGFAGKDREGKSWV